MLKQCRSAGLTAVFKILKWAGMVLLLFSSVANAHSVQTIESQEQLISMLCRNPNEDAVNDVVSNNARLVNVTLWNALLNCASSGQKRQSPAKSLEIYKLTIRVAELLHKPELVATTYYYLGRTYSGMNDIENSTQAYETSRKLFEQAGLESNLIYVLADLAALYLTAEDYEKAQRYSEQNLALARQTRSSSTKESLAPIEYGEARAQHTLGEIDMRQGNHDEAIKKLGEALMLYERLNSADSSYSIQIADVLIVLTNVYCEMGQYGQAFSYLNKAEQISRSSADQNTRANIMKTQGSLLLEQEDYAVAQRYLNASLAIYRALGNMREEARVLLQLAVVEQRQGHNDEALPLFQRSMERANTARLVDVQIGAAEGLAIASMAKGDFPNALRVINQSLEIARRVNAKTREAELLWHAAQTHYAMQEYRQSAAESKQALALARSLGLRKLTYLATASLGEAYAADDEIELAITTLKDAINQIEELRNQLAGRQEVRYLFFENKVGPYHTIIRLLNKQGNTFEALLFAEQVKGRMLREAIRNNRTDLNDIYTESEKAEAEFLINKLHAINQRIQSQPSGSEPKDELENKMTEVRGELELFQEKLALAHPELPLRAGPVKPLTYAGLTNLLRTNNVAYLEYVVTGNNVGIFILKRNGTADHHFRYITLPVNANELRRKVHEFQLALAERQPGYHQFGHELYRLLIAPVASELQNIRTVCVIPDEFLWTLPFQALITTRGNYFVQEYSLYYAPSLTVLNEMISRRRQQTSKESLIAFGNPVINTEDQLKQDLHPIPEAESEVTGIAAAVRTHLKKVLVGAQATEELFKALAPQFATIHVATHGILDNRDPLNSYLLLTRTDGDSENDGLLQAREILDMHLDADLAVLSACETGNGRISPGEGVIGMSWAFLVAGARSVVVSQWSVNSASTSQLMKNFYQALARQRDRNGVNTSQALRQASLHLLKDRRYRHPFYWAGFVLVSSN